MPSRYEVHVGLTSATGGGGGAGVDHFQPKYLVGNVPAGDDVAGYNTGGFMYIPDPGDGSGIALALTQPNGPGDIGIRPGDYNLALGAVVTPMVVPAGVKIVGSGPMTRILSRASGDQGVFVFGGVVATGLLCLLRDLSIEGVAATDGTGASTALVRCTAPIRIEDVSVSVTTRVVGVIREAVRFENVAGSQLPPSNVINLRIGVATEGTEAMAVRGIVLAAGTSAGAVVFAHQLEVYDQAGNGFGDAIRSESGICVIQSFISFGAIGATIRHIVVPGIGQGVIRVDEGQCVAGGLSTVATRGFLLEGGSHVVRSVAFQGSGGTVGTAVEIAFVPGQDAVGIEVDDIQVGGGFRVGVDATGVTDLSVVNSLFDVSSLGVRISGTSSSCHLKGNTISVFNDPAIAKVAGIHLAPGGFAQHVEGNTVNVQGDPLSLAPGVHGIWCQSQLSTVATNTVTASYVGYCIEVDQERVVTDGNITQGAEGPGCIHVAPGRVRCTVNGNNCTFNTTVVPAPLPAAIVYEGAQGAVGDNTIFMGTPAPPASGIVLTAASSNSTCIGNVSEGSVGIPVANLAATNEVAHNVGA